jgi:hypothetical protein
LLFGAERALRAPQANEPLPSIEPRRAHEGTRTSLFDDSVQDPPPPQQVARRAASPARIASERPEPVARQVADIPAADTPRLEPAVARVAPEALGLEPAVARVAPEASSLEPAVSRVAAKASSFAPAAPPPPPPEAIRPRNASATGHSAVRPESVQVRDYGDHATAPPDKPAERTRAAPDPVPPKRVRKRRATSGLDRLTLWGLGLASLVALGSACVLLGLVPGPFGPGRAATSKASENATPALKPANPAPKPATAVVVAHPQPQPAKPAATLPAEAPPAPRVAQPPTSPAQAAVAVAAPAAAETHPALSPKPEGVKSEAPKPEASKPEASAPTAGAKPAAAEDEPGGQGALLTARKKLAEDDPQGAETLMRQVLAKDPQDHHAMELLAHALMDQDRGAEALPYARKIVQRRPRRVAYRLLLGDLLLMVGDVSAARVEWQEASKIAPGDPQIKRRLVQ